MDDLRLLTRDVIIRLVVKDRKRSILSVRECHRYRKDGRKDKATLELFLDLAIRALEDGDIPTMEFIHPLLDDL